MFLKEVIIPQQVSVEVAGDKVKVSGPKGQIERQFKTFYDIKIEKTKNKMKIFSESEKRKVKAMTGTIAGHIKNMIKGVTQGFTYRLRVIYLHFPVTVKVEGDKVLLQNFLGERTPRVAKIVGDAKVEVKGADIEVTGIDIEEVGETANNIEQAARIKARDRRVFQDGIWIIGKE